MPSWLGVAAFMRGWPRCNSTKPAPWPAAPIFLPVGNAHRALIFLPRLRGRRRAALRRAGGGEVFVPRLASLQLDGTRELASRHHFPPPFTGESLPPT